MNRPNHRHNGPRRHKQAGTHSQRGRDSETKQRAQSAHVRSQAPAEDLIMGRNCVEEVVRLCPDRLREVYMVHARDGERLGAETRRGSLREKIVDLGVPLRDVRRDELDAMVQSESHQGVVARVVPRQVLPFEDLVQRATQQEQIGILALDGVLDPQNLGAILRAAECFGVSAVLWSKNRSAPLGPVVSKASVGASEIVSLCPVSNLHRSLEALKETGVWSIGAVVAPDAIPLKDFDRPNKWVLVMGSEGEGLQRLIEQNLDFRVYISMLGELSSLNVSQATAVMLHALGQR
jgi:23S rRNA (guanosine2251-2'-O)-methyltransferase